MATKTTNTGLFNSQLVTEIFNKVKGHSTLAMLANQTPIPFAGNDIMIFSMDGEASIVGEGGNKPAGEADWKKVTIKPIKFVYQHRLTDEFVNLAEEAQVPYLAQFSDGFAKKIARALDISALHGVNPADKETSATIGDNCFDKGVTATVTYDAANADDNIQEAVGDIQDKDGVANGIAMTPAFATALGNIKQGTANNKVALYPEYRFGGNPGSFGGMKADVNNTVAFGGSDDMAIVGDFENAFRWGYTENVPIEIIEYGDPDGQGDLKRTNEIVLRAEAYIGWGIVDPDSFARVVKAA
jgi:HK97 family phage major capsid protein